MPLSSDVPENGWFPLPLSILVAFWALFERGLQKVRIFDFLASNINLFVDAGFDIADVVGRCLDAIPAIPLANLLIEVLWSFGAHLLVPLNRC